MRITKSGILMLSLLALALLALVWVAPGEAGAANRVKVTEAHEGQVEVYDGVDWIWMTPIEGLAVNDITLEDVVWRGGTPSYVGSAYTALRGVDVSFHQNEIDWKKVRAAGYEVAIIQAGNRGYTKGGLFEDSCFAANMQGAIAAGMRVGVYFFSQAVTVEEALEEAELTLRLLEPYREGVTMPVYFDWEKIYEYDTEPRTLGLDSTVLSDCAVAFCEAVREAGYQPGVYISRPTGYYGLDLTRLQDVNVWFTLPEAKFPSFYYHVDAWQYSFTAQVPGIPTETDVNLFFFPKG